MKRRYALATLAVLLTTALTGVVTAQVDLDLDALLGEIDAPDAQDPPAEAAPEEAIPSAEDADVELPEDPVEAAELTAEQEVVLRQAREQQGRDAYAQAQTALRRGQYREAAEGFERSLQLIPVRAATDEIRIRARLGRAEATLRRAEAAFDRDELDDARSFANEAIRIDEERFGDRARGLIRRIDRRRDRLEVIERMPVDVPDRPAVRRSRETAHENFEEGRRYFEAGEYDRAETLFEQVLLVSPYHRDAMRYLRRIEERRLEATNIRRQTTVAEAVHEVRRRWHPPIREVVRAPERPEDVDPTDRRLARRLRERMEAITIPRIDFRDADIQDVIAFLRDVSEEQDPDRMGGVNIILQIEGAAPARPAPTPAPVDPGDFWGIDPEPLLDTPATPRAPSRVDPISLTLRNVSLLDAIRYVTDVAGLRYRIEDNAVIITPKDRPVGALITRFYPVQPSIVDVVIEREEQPDTGFGRPAGDFIGMPSAQAEVRRADVRSFFEQSGVPFPEGTSITYNAQISQLIVTNTAENLELFERILAQLNVIPNQVEIEARFVEIGQDDLEELGFQWLLTDNMNLAIRRGSGPIASRERIQLNRNMDTGGFTSGLRRISETAPLMSVSSVLTNPELSFLLNAMQQRGGTDLLSAPRVTVQSGATAQIQVVRELVYPVEWMEQAPGEFVAAEFRVPYPTAFETREVGVILNVTADVGADGYTIRLSMVPEVSELATWIDYGPPEIFPILKPIFQSRSVTTSIVLWDSQTVVMGGLIREEIEHIDDRIPLLGDLPLIGRLFRSRGERSSKQNLIVFVTARLVDPAGNPIHQAGALGAGLPTPPESP